MTHTATTDKSTRIERALYIAFDMGRGAWQLASSDGGKTRREVKLDRTDVERGKADVVAEIAKARAAFGLPGDAPAATKTSTATARRARPSSASPRSAARAARTATTTTPRSTRA